MGMSSNLTDEEIEVIDKDGLKDYLIKNKDEEIISCLWDKKDIEIFSFNGWDSHKIISYWYQETLTILRDLAVFIEGFVKFEFETGEEFAIINFRDGKCDINLGVLQYEKYKPEQLWQDYDNKDSKMPPLSDELNARLIIRKI